MRINLKNINEFDTEKLSGKANNFLEAFELSETKTSFKDGGVGDFTEVTDINKISFGHFIIIEQILSLELSEEDKLRKVLPYLVRPFLEDLLDNEDEEKEEDHKEEVEQMAIGSVYGVFNRFIAIRNEYLFKTYNGVIYGTLTEDEDDGTEDNEEDTDTQTSSALSSREFYNKKFFWYNLIGAVANDDIFRRQAAVELPMYEVMPFLAEKRNKAIVENLEAKSRR